MTNATGGRPNQPGGDEVGKTVVRRVEWREFGDGSTPIGDDHFFTSSYSIEVLAQAILQVAYPDLRP